jgi:natural product precursor
MVSKSKKENAGKKKKIKVLNLNKETVKNLTDNEAKRVKGGTTACLIGGVRPRASVVEVSLSCFCAGTGTLSVGVQSY